MDILTKEQVIMDLRKLSDLPYQEFSQKLSPDSHYQIMGVRVPKIRELSKSYHNFNIDEYLDNPSFTYLEECQLYGLLLNNEKKTFQEIEKYLRKFIPFIDSWAICDIFCLSLKVCKKAPEAMWDFIQPYLQSEKEFEIRFGLIIMLGWYINDKYFSKVMEIADQIRSSDYYVRMGVAWLISTCYIKKPSIVLAYLQGENHLDKFTYNKTLSKITDSFRVKEADKEIIRKMHKK